MKKINLPKGVNRTYKAMARDWFIRNKNAGNVLKTGGLNIASSQVIKPDANITVLNIDLVEEITLTGNAESSIPGDLVIVAIQNNTGGSLNLTADGDFAFGSLTINAGGVGSAILVYNGQNFASTL